MWENLEPTLGVTRYWVAAFNVPQLTQALFLQNKQTLQNVFLISEIAESLSSLEKSEFLILIISFFH